MRVLPVLPLLLSLSAWAAPPDRSHLDTVPVSNLKVVYLECARRSSVSLLDGADAANCSLVYEELMERGFDGDFKRMLAWWRDQQRREPDLDVPMR